MQIQTLNETALKEQYRHAQPGRGATELIAFVFNQFLNAYKIIKP